MRALAEGWVSPRLRLERKREGGETEEPIGRQHPTQLSITLCGRDCALPQPSFLQLGEFQWTTGSPRLCI